MEFKRFCICAYVPGAVSVNLRRLMYVFFDQDGSLALDLLCLQTKWLRFQHYLATNEFAPGSWGSGFSVPCFAGTSPPAAGDGLHI